MITVLVIAPGAVVRAGLRALVAASPGLAVAGEAQGWMDAANRIEELQPDVLLVEAGQRGEEVGAFLNGGSPPVVLLVDDAAMGYIKAGVRAVLPHSASATEIAAAIEAVAAGLIALHPDALEPAPVDTGLTARELEILRMLAEGLANKEIAYRLKISEHTVKFHVAAVFGKLHASTRTEAVTLGIRQGLIML